MELNSEHPIFGYIWGLVLDGSICHESYHRLLGFWFGYPECCINFYLEKFDKPDLTYICIVNHPELGEYIQCHKCWNEVNLMKTKVARDSKQQIMWIKGRTDLSPLTYYEWREGMDMVEGGSITKDGHIFYAPFTIGEEEVPKDLTLAKYYGKER